MLYAEGLCFAERNTQLRKVASMTLRQRHNIGECNRYCQYCIDEMDEEGGVKMIVIVPNYIADQINAKLDAAYMECPAAAVDRAFHYQALLNHFDESGVIPDFELKKNRESGE